MHLVYILLLASLPLSATDYYDQGKLFAEGMQKCKDRPESEKDLLREKIASVKAESKNGYRENNEMSEEKLPHKKCLVSPALVADPQTSLYVFVSFSVPVETMIDLSRELEKTGGVFVLRGLPNNSFRELSIKIHSLRQQGVKAPLQIDPKLFGRFDVQSVPCFVVTEGDRFDKLLGNVSLSFALEKMASQGETTNAKNLMKLL